MQPEIVVPLGFFAMITMIVFAVVNAKAAARRLERESPRGAALPAEASLRLARMEQAIESIAVEIERISEGQRFTTKVLADRSGVPAAGQVLPRAAGEDSSNAR